MIVGDVEPKTREPASTKSCRPSHTNRRLGSHLGVYAKPVPCSVGRQVKDVNFHVGGTELIVVLVGVGGNRTRCGSDPTARNNSLIVAIGTVEVCSPRTEYVPIVVHRDLTSIETHLAVPAAIGCSYCRVLDCPSMEELDLEAVLVHPQVFYYLGQGTN